MSVNVYDKTTGLLTRAAGPAGANITDNYVGTFAAWSLLSDEQKAQYKTCDFTDDEGTSGLGLHVVSGQLYCRYKVVTND